MGEKGEGIKKYKLIVADSYGDMKYSIRNTVDNVVILCVGPRFIIVIMS